MISVVIPLYNKQDYISRAIKSVANQLYTDWELIIIDDQSLDGSVDEVKKFISDNNFNIKLFHQKNAGQSAARNFGIDRSCGDIIAFLDADDEWHPDFLHTIHALFKLFPSAGMFGTGWRKIFYPKFICKNKWHMDVTVSDNDGAESFIVNDYFKKSLVAPICWVGSTAVRADVAREMNGFKIGEHMGGDRDFWGRIALKYNLAYSSKILGIYRTDSDKRENSRSDRKLQSPPFINEGQNFLKNKTNVDKEKNLMIKMYINSLYLNYFLKSIRAGKSKIIYNLLKENLIINKDISVYLLIISFYVTPIKITQFILKILSHNLFSKKNVFKYNVKVNTYKAKKI